MWPSTSGLSPYCHPVFDEDGELAYTRKREKRYQGFYKEHGKQVYVVSAQRKEDALRAAEEAERSARLGETLSRRESDDEAAFEDCDLSSSH